MFALSWQRRLTPSSRGGPKRKTHHLRTVPWTLPQKKRKFAPCWYHPAASVGGHPAKAWVIMAALTRETVLRFLVLVIFVVVSSVSVVYLTLHHATADEVYDFVILGGPRRPRSQP